jgi:hypothetical protein
MRLLQVSTSNGKQIWSREIGICTQNPMNVRHSFKFRKGSSSTRGGQKIRIARRRVVDGRLLLFQLATHDVCQFTIHRSNRIGQKGSIGCGQHEATSSSAKRLWKPASFRQVNRYNDAVDRPSHFHRSMRAEPVTKSLRQATTPLYQ